MLKTNDTVMCIEINESMKLGEFGQVSTVKEENAEVLINNALVTLNVNDLMKVDSIFD